MKPVASHWALGLCPLVLLSSCMTAPEEKLRMAAAEGNLLRVQTFLGQGISAQAADRRGVTPLFLAAKNGHPDVVAVLLERGVAMNPVRQDGVTPIFIAAQEGQREVVALLFIEERSGREHTGWNRGSHALACGGLSRRSGAHHPPAAAWSE